MRLRALLVVALVSAGAVWAQAQSLAEIARAEEARRKDVTQPSKVYTNDTLKPDFTRATPSTPAEPAAPAAADASGTASPADAPAESPGAAAPVRDQSYWAGRIAEARSQVERSRAFATALQNRIDMLWTDFVNRDNPVERSGIEQERIKALAELDHVKKEIEDQTKSISAIEDEARRAGVPPGWLRPS
ncbi:MAG: hypothetical protein IT180_04940 [Acidobacteria bacterium]|nr:hypothetical protein [Acidobacteriota bacterium]